MRLPNPWPSARLDDMKSSSDEPIAKLPVAVEPKPGEGQERLLLAPFRVLRHIPLWRHGVIRFSGHRVTSPTGVYH